MPVMAAGGIPGSPISEIAGKFANTLAMKNGMLTVMKMPMTSKAFTEKMSNNARPQRRFLGWSRCPARLMPRPCNHISPPPRRVLPDRLTGGAFGALAAIICPNSVGSPLPARPPSSRVRMPKIIRPVDGFCKDGLSVQWMQPLGFVRSYGRVLLLIRPFPNRVENLKHELHKLTRIELAKISEIRVKGLCRRPSSFRAKTLIPDRV